MLPGNLKTLLRSLKIICGGKSVRGKSTGRRRRRKRRRGRKKRPSNQIKVVQDLGNRISAVKEQLTFLYNNAAITLRRCLSVILRMGLYLFGYRMQVATMHTKTQHTHTTIKKKKKKKLSHCTGWVTEKQRLPGLNICTFASFGLSLLLLENCSVVAKQKERGKKGKYVKTAQ